MFVVAAALCAKRASSLYCYKCNNERYHKDCQEVKCSDTAVFCVTAWNEIHDQDPLFSKWCSPTCPKAGEIERVKRSVDCCQTNYCNGGASSARGSYALLGAALLASCFYALRTGL
ncbi:UNVERIFIED_CONTAM: hypothetical protein K2H54_005805 [Gekko kuhli]